MPATGEATEEMKTARTRKYLVLIVTLVGVLLLHSFSRHAAMGSLVSHVLVTLAVLAVFLTVFNGARERAIAFLAAAAAIVVVWAHHVAPTSLQFPLEIAHYVLQALFVGFAVVVILTSVLRQKRVTSDEVLGAVCGYLLAGVFFGNVYSLIELLSPGSFSMSQQFAADLATWDGRISLFDYFSLVTLTTMGYGDVTPVHGPARTFALIEAVFGQFYIAVLVAQLVGLRLAQAMQPNDAGG